MNIQQLQLEINENLKLTKSKTSCRVNYSGMDFTIHLVTHLNVGGTSERHIEIPVSDFEKTLQSFQNSNKNKSLNRLLKLN